MANYTAGKVAADELIYVSAAYSPAPYAPAALTGSLPASSAARDLTPSVRDGGDYLAVFAATSLLATASGRNTLYETPEKTTAVVREVTLSNPTASPVTARLWIGGSLVEAGLPVPPGESRSQTLGGWIIGRGERLEAEGAGLVVYASGIEEVR